MVMSREELALAYYDWPWWLVPKPRRSLPDYRMNLFLQAKRSNYCARTPRAAKAKGLPTPCFGFRLTDHQQQSLLRLAAKLGPKAHVAYAAPAFHTVPELRQHVRGRSIVRHSTFPSANALAMHEAWYYREPGATGVANPDPENIEERPLEARLAALIESAPETQGLQGFDELAEQIVALAREAPDDDGVAPEFLTDIEELDRLLEPYELPATVVAYARISTFAALYGLSWLVIGRDA